MAGPYKAEAWPGFWILVDTRTGEPASFPTTKSKCQREAAFMNRTYAELMAEEENKG